MHTHTHGHTHLTLLVIKEIQTEAKIKHKFFTYQIDKKK